VAKIRLQSQLVCRERARIKRSQHVYFVPGRAWQLLRRNKVGFVYASDHGITPVASSKRQEHQNPKIAHDKQLTLELSGRCRKELEFTATDSQRSA
jgi:hypothetical protein